jgi:hypothetical protein
MKTIRFFVMTGVALCFSFCASASTITATAADQPIVPGEWSLGLSNAWVMAQATGIPIVGFWANTGCQKCAAVIDQAVNTPEFTAWRQARQLLMVTGEGKGGLAGELYNWIRNAAESDGDNDYPFIRILWVGKDGTVRVDTQFSGYPYRASAQTLINKIESYVAEFRYAGVATFGFTAGPEMEPGTVAAPLPLVRRNGSSGTLTNTLSFVRTLEAGGTTNWTETLIWAAGETNRNIYLANQGHYTNGTVTLTLKAEGEADQTRVVTMVAAQEISVHNPRFAGEPFHFGEWTLDLDAATNAVAASGVATARTLVLFSGLWCPYCSGYEEDVLDSAEFKEFARTNCLALVEINIPSRDGMYAGALLTHNVFTNQSNAADRRIGLNGTGYMTRHGITPEAGWAFIQRTLAFERLMTLPGKTFVNLPAVIVSRKNGDIAGRIPGYYCFNYRSEGNVYPRFMRFPLECNMMRLHELLDMTQGDPTYAYEERNTYASWTTETLAVQTPLGESLSSVDGADVFALDAVNSAVQRVSLTGSDPVSVAVSLLSNGVAVATSSGRLSDGVTVTAPVASNVAYFVSVVTADLAAFTNAALSSTVHAYTAATTFELIAREKASTVRVAAVTNGTGVCATSLAVVKDGLYRFTATEAAFTLEPGAFEPVAGTNGLYRATSGGTAELTLTARSAAGTFTWQIWNPGTVGFAQTTTSVPEASTNVVLVVQRTEGSSGACSVSVNLDATNSTATAGEDFTDVFSAGIVLTWADGEVGPKTFSVPLLSDWGYEGDEVVALTLTVTAGAATLAANGADHRLTIVDDDQPVTGRLAFVVSDRVFVKTSPLTIVAREGSQLSLGVERVEGASAAVSASVAATAGTVSPAALTWANNDRVRVKTATVALPKLADVPRGVVTLTLTPDGGVQTVSGKDTVIVQLVAADAPAFTQETAAFFGQTQVAFDRMVSVLQSTSGKITVAKRSGTLPAGIVAKADQTSGGLRLTGVPTKEGTYTAVYQVSELRGSQKVAGGVVQVTVAVAALGTLNEAAADSVSEAEGAVIDSGTRRVVGTLRVSVTQAARMTAKYLTKKGTVTFSGKSWTACDANGVLTAVLSKGNYGVSVQMTSAGDLSAAVTDPDYSDTLEAELHVPAWSESNPATNYVGYYTVSLSPSTVTGGLAPTGYSYMTVSVRSGAAKTGRVTYAGKLADGTPYSGSAVLQPIDAGQAGFIVFTRDAKHVFAGVLELSAHAAETYKNNPSAVSACGSAEPYWACDSGSDETSFDIALEICGGFYNSGDSLLDYYALYAGTGPMELMATGDVPESDLYGTATALPQVDLAISESALRIPSGTVDSTKTQLSFTKATGVFRGTFRLPFINALSQTQTVSASYAGVLLPGWTGDCGCGDNEVNLPAKPFGMGSYWFSDRVPVGTAGESRTMSVSRGYPIIMQKVSE